MAHLWKEDPAEGWILVRLDPDSVFSLEEIGALSRHADPPRAFLTLARSSNQPTWVVIAEPSAGLLVNGVPAELGIRVLCDRDQITCGQACTFFSMETLAEIEPLPDEGRRLRCRRCQQTIEPGTPAVRCPRCGIWHHQSEDLPCWTYAENCALCSQPTDLSGGFAWTPFML
ncbi:MAG: hypothetical protein HYX76_02115 [Acidobacteria bacterium]|nr:hypothetical protein [Acidobacteriota bacterium]